MNIVRLPIFCVLASEALLHETGNRLADAVLLKTDSFC